MPLGTQEEFEEFARILKTKSPKSEFFQEITEAWTLSGEPHQERVQELLIQCLDGERCDDVKVHALVVCIRSALERSLPINWISGFNPEQVRKMREGHKKLLVFFEQQKNRNS